MKKCFLIFLLATSCLSWLIACRDNCTHAYDEWVVTIPATCTETGIREHTCSNCSYKESEVIPATGHIFSENWSSDETNHWHESTCGHDIKSEEGVHTWMNEICSICSLKNIPPSLSYTLISEGTEYSVGLGTEIKTDIVIPAIYDGIPVTAIDSSAFYGCSNLTSISIPNTVISIGNEAFYGCSGLDSITVESGNPNYHSENNCLIETKTNTLILGCKNSRIPKNGSVTSIGDGAFYGCSGLTSIIIPDNVTSIGFQAFYGCRDLENISIPDTTIYIGFQAFYDCDKLQFTDSDNAYYLGNSNNPYLVFVRVKHGLCANFTINSQTKFIASTAFYGSNNLEYIIIPETVVSIGDSAFFMCTSLSNIIFNGTTDQWLLITKEECWDSGTNDYNVICTNGKISKDGTVTLT